MPRPSDFDLNIAIETCIVKRLDSGDPTKLDRWQLVATDLDGKTWTRDKTLYTPSLAQALAKEIAKRGRIMSDAWSKR